MDRKRQILVIGSSMAICTKKAYKMAEIVPGKYQRKDVQSYYATVDPLSTTGFELVIEGSLTGVIVEYAFIER